MILSCCVGDHYLSWPRGINRIHRREMVGWNGGVQATCIVVPVPPSVAEGFPLKPIHKVHVA